MSLFFKGFNVLGFAIPLISELFMFLDYIIYFIASQALKAFFQIADISANIATEAPEINYIMQRVMMLVGVFALFRISISLINYLINPDKIKDLQKSSTSVVSSIVIALILLVSSTLTSFTLSYVFCNNEFGSSLSFNKCICSVPSSSTVMYV